MGRTRFPASQALYTWYIGSLGSLRSVWGQDSCLQPAEDRVRIIWIYLGSQKNLHFVFANWQIAGNRNSMIQNPSAALESLSVLKPVKSAATAARQWSQQVLAASGQCQGSAGELGFDDKNLSVLLDFSQPESTLPSSAYLTWDWRGSRRPFTLAVTCRFIQYNA